MANFPGGTALSGKDGEEAAKAATVQSEEPQMQAEAPEIAADEAANTERGAEPESDQISVFASRMVYKNPVTHNSESVKQLQRRLVELGFVEAGSDQAGLLADGTKAAVAAYQTKHKLESTGEVDSKTLKAIFRGDKGVKVVLD